MHCCRDPACAGEEGSFAAILTFSIPLETRQEFALLPLPFPPAHRMGMDLGGGQSWEMPHSQAVRARADDGVHGCTHVAHPVPVAPSPRHREAHGMLIPVLSSPQYRHPAQPLLTGTRSRAERGLCCPPQPWGLVPGGSGGPLPSPRRAGASGAAWSYPGGLDTPFSFKLMAVP